jgi:hypothetical protein
MKRLVSFSWPGLALVFCAAGVSVLCMSADAAVQIIGVQHQRDQFFPEDNCIWHDRQYPGPCSSAAFTGQVVKVFLKNTGAASATVTDATLPAGASTRCFANAW